MEREFKKKKIDRNRSTEEGNKRKVKGKRKIRKEKDDRKRNDMKL